MPFKGKNTITLIIIAFLASGCDLLDKAEKFFIKNTLPKKEVVTEQKQITISCKKGNIQKYIDQGWEVINSNSKEVTCTWKSKQAKPGCNMERDKGCRITVPDKKGKEIQYLLKRENYVPKN